MEKSKADFLLKEFKKITNFFKLKNFDIVIKRSKKLLKKYPNFSPIYNFLGLSHRELGNIKLAEKIFLEGYYKDPNNPGILINLGAIYRLKRDRENSIKFFKDAMKINPNDIALLVNYGNALSDFNKVKESIIFYEKAMSIDENNQTILINLSSAYQILGKFKESRKLLNQTIQKFPGLTVPHKLLADITRYKNNDRHQTQMLNYAYQIEKNKTNLEDELKYPLYFAIAKSFDDQKDFNNAFIWFKKGNETKKKIIVRTAEKLKQENPITKELKFLNKINGIFQNIDVTKYDKENKNGENLIFILGLPRSGTTLTHQIIASHSKTFGGGELDFLSQTVYNNIDEKEFINIFESYDFEKLNKLIKDYIGRCNYINNQGKVIIDKSPMNFRMIGFIRMLFPKSKIVYCTRDAKDNCLSIYKNVFNESNIPWSYDVKDLSSYYKEYKKIMNFWKAKMPGFIFESNYELLVMDQEKHSRKIFDFCNLNWEKETLEFYKKSIPIQTLSKEQARNPVYQSSLNNYKDYSNYLDFSEISSIENSYI